jgi:hypothetical protein
VTLIVDRGGRIQTLVKPNNIYVGPIFTVAATPNDTTCYWQPITLDATTPCGTYLWEPGGATTPAITVNSNDVGLGAHTYNVTVSTPDGCSRTKSSTIFFDVCSGITEPAGSLSVNVFPNPNNGEFTLSIHSGNAMSASLNIMNTPGMTRYSENGLAVNGNLDRKLKPGNLAPGIYFLTLQSGENRIIKKIFVN